MCFVSTETGKQQNMKHKTVTNLLKTNSMQSLWWVPLAWFKLLLRVYWTTFSHFFPILVLYDKYHDVVSQHLLNFEIFTLIIHLPANQKQMSYSTMTTNLQTRLLVCSLNEAAEAPQTNQEGFFHVNIVSSIILILALWFGCDALILY